MWEAEIEAALERPPAPPAAIGGVRELHGGVDDYLRELGARFADLRLDGLRILLDCANGATHRAAPAIFGRLGATVEALAVSPDSRVSRMTSTRGACFSDCSVAARPRASPSSAVSNSPATPRTPSVPKSWRAKARG